MQITAAEIKRPQSNLLPDTKYSLPALELRTGFLGVFRRAYKGEGRKSLFRVAMAAFMDTAHMSTGRAPRPKSQEERTARRNYIKEINLWAEARAKQNLQQYTKLSKVNDGDKSHFTLDLPIAIIRSVPDLLSMLRFFTPVLPNEEQLTVIDAALSHELGVDSAGKQVLSIADFYTAGKVLANAHLGSDAQALFSTCLKGVRVTRTGSGSLLALVFNVPARTAEYLTSMDWLEIRAIDLYPLFSGWVEAEYVPVDYSKTTTSISKIAATLPQHQEADERIDQYGIGITYSGEPIFLPKTCNRTNDYESKFAAASVANEGAFALRTPEKPDTPALPSNIPILVDWVNFKFAYTDTMGKIKVQMLEHVRKCNPSMAMNLLHNDMPVTYVKGLMGYARQCSMGTRIFPESGDGNGAEVDAFFESFLKHQELATPGYSPRYVDITMGTDFPELMPLVRWVSALYRAMLTNLDALYERYAVTTITDQLGMIAVIGAYGDKLEETRAAANTLNKKAANQGVDPNWTPPPLPLLTKGFAEEGKGVQPHQLKILNIAKERPDNMILDVAAGGGKSLLAVTDVLKEIAAGESAPYLIMCPATLIANYVSEIVEFTDGKLNVIPITSYNIRTSGYKRYQEILKAAPLNTVLVVDYDALKFRSRAAGYGTATVRVYPVIDMIRQFNPGYAYLDEAHILKNPNSARAAAVMYLVADIPKKRLASGTLTPDSPSDLAGELAILDPTILGSRDKFNEKYGESTAGGRVTKWKETGNNAVSRVIPRVMNSIVWAKAERKEWAYALPNREDRFLAVQLTDNQKTMYDALFDDMIQQIRKRAETDKNARRLLDGLLGKSAAAEDEDAFGDLSDTDEVEDDGEEGADIGPALQPYLADIERFVTDPASHPYSRNGFVKQDGTHVAALTGDDLKSGKALALQQCMEEWFKSGKTSKILIFVNYNASADSLFNAMSPELQECGLRYSTSQKTEHVNKFKTDPNIKWMIGIRKSLETGLNLQAAGYLIRIEGVWTPGEQEQGDSRVARPFFGAGGDKRSGILFDTIVADRTIDVTKAARLRAKIVANAKFLHPTDPVYQSIESIPVIQMTLDSIMTQNDFNNELRQYHTSIEQLNTVIKAEYAEYKAKVEATGGSKFTQIPAAPIPPGCAILSSVPYAQGTELYSASELGLVRVDNYLGMDLTDEEDVEGDDEGGESAETLSQKQKIMGKRCHCESGDGIIVGATGGDHIHRVHVRLDDGTTAVGLPATTVFIVTRTETNGEDMRLKLAQAAGLPMVGRITAPSGNVRETKITKREQMEIEKEQERLAEEERKRSRPAQLSIGLDLSIVNGYMRVGYVIGKEVRAVKALESLGFKKEPQYVGTRIRSYKHLINQASLWAKAGFNTSSDTDDDTFAVLADELAKGGLTTHHHFLKTLARANFSNYMRKAWKATADKRMLQLFALVTDGGDRDPAAIKEAQRTGVTQYGQAYLCLPYGGGHPATRLAIASKYKSPSTRWLLSDPALSVYVANIQGVHKILKSLQDAGIAVNNIAELNKQAKSVKKINPKTDNTVDVK
jgi:hypothetical protein